MTKKRLCSLSVLLLTSTLASTLQATESQRLSDPVQEDSLLKSFKPDEVPSTKRERTSIQNPRIPTETPSDTNVHQDPLLKSFETNDLSIEKVEKKRVKTEKKSPSKKAVQHHENEYKKKSSKVQEDPLLQMLDPK